ncbi:putative leucine-rich repeat-containing protein DDB_G0281931 [Actinia tenebrosa]|uniref:Leucine-rich repeat-containing protein DDB_G0281931 n=1 Tax=Actinia tenebrosa TaxID=6105 RepID=A0A6P8I0G5_ACTTE|nr:putative leucine-rich repeat-containing protein DDB_G0281931 [Actinia tenebrosa]
MGGQCVACPAGGFYQDEQAQYEILSHGLGCKQCPDGTFVSLQSSPGVQRADCQTCPDETKHMYLNFSAELQLNSQSYNKSLAHYTQGLPKAYACLTASACKGGIDSECSVGYEGPMCAMCSRHFYMLASICRKCPTLPWIVTQIILVIVIVVGLIVLLIRDKKNKSSGRSLSDIMTARLKILIGFYQVTSGTISSFSYVHWPDAMIKLVRYAEVFQMNLLQAAPLHCISDSLKTNVHVKLLAAVLFNVVAIMAGIVYYHIRVRQIPSKRRSLLQQRCYRTVFLILFISFPMTCSYIFQALPETCQEVCTSTDEKFCKSYLKSDYSVECGSKTFKVKSLFSYVLVFYPVGFPSLIFYLLWKYYYKGGKHASREERVHTKNDGIVEGLKFVYENYASNVWFWEIIELVRKVLLTSVILLAHAESRTYLGVTAIISGIYAVLFAYYKPITDTFEHWLQLTSLLATMVNMIVGMLLKIPSDSLSSSVNTHVDEAFVTAVLMIANVAVIAIMAVNYMVTLVQTVQVIRKNPQCSISCCLYLFLTINQAGSDVSGIEGNNDLKNYQDMNMGVR